MLLLLSVLCCCYIYAQRTAVVTATATYEAPLNMSPIEAEYEAVRHAQINAIAREFGTIVTSESHNYMRENNSISSDDFFSYGEMDVRGEWLETIGDTIWQPARREGGMVVYDVKLKGRIHRPMCTTRSCTTAPTPSSTVCATVRFTTATSCTSTSVRRLTATSPCTLSTITTA